jgi:hypothetical protein
VSTHGVVMYYIRPFSTLPLNRGERSTSRTGRCTISRIHHWYPLNRRLAGSQSYCGNTRKKSFSYLCRQWKHDFSVTTYGHNDLLGARQERKPAENGSMIVVSLAHSHRKNSNTLMYTVLRIVYEHVTNSMEIVSLRLVSRFMTVTKANELRICRQSNNRHSPQVTTNVHPVLHVKVHTL